jgi:hypothetical protein
MKKSVESMAKEDAFNTSKGNAMRKRHLHRAAITLPVHTKKRANAHQHPISSRSTSCTSGHCHKHKDHCDRSSGIDAQSEQSCDGGDDDCSLVHARARARSVRRIQMRIYQYFDFHSSWMGLL